MSAVCVSCYNYLLRSDNLSKPLENLTEALIDGEIQRGGGIDILLYEINFSLTNYNELLSTYMQRMVHR